jgi:hypothetical protein
MLHFIMEFLVIFPVIGLLNCTIIGTEIGKKIDGSQPDEIAYSSMNIGSVRIGSKVTLIMKDGFRLDGKFLGSDYLSMDKYKQIYQNARYYLIREIILPEIGEIMTLHPRPDNKPYKVTFLGFDYYHLMVETEIRDEPFKIPLTNFEELVDDKGNILAADMVAKLISESKIPLLTTVSLQTDELTRQIRVDEIREFRIKTSKKGKLVGMFMGWSIDLILFLMATSDIWG